MADGRVDQYGGESNFGLFGKATGAVVDAVKRDERVLVHCHKGESRSAAVCIAAVGTIHEVPYAEAFRRVAAVRDIYPHPVLGAYAQRYIEQNG